MRTTLTLDEDVRAKLESQMRRTGKSFKDTVNETLRIGLTAASQPKSANRFVVRPWPLGLPEGFSYDNIEELIEQLEGPLHR